MGRIVVMSGYPASGKSTLAASLAARLDFTLVCKDALLAAIFQALGGTMADPTLSLRSGQAAWAAFWLLARSGGDLVLDSNINGGDPAQRDALQALPGPIVEVRCECPLALAQERYGARAAAVRHPAQRTERLDAERAGLYAAPLGVGRLIRVETSSPVDLEALAGQVLEAFR